MNPITRNAKLILKKFKQKKKIFDWKLTEVNLNKHSLYLTKDSQTENYSQTKRSNVYATVYIRKTIPEKEKPSKVKKVKQKKIATKLKKFKSKKFKATKIVKEVKEKKTENWLIGDATVPLISSNQNHMREKIREAIISANFVNNPFYTIPDKSQISEIKKEVGYSPELTDSNIVNFYDESYRDALTKLSKKFISEFKNRPNMRISSAEFHITYSNIELFNSRDMKESKARTNIYIELVITAFSKKDEQEYMAIIEASRLSDIKIKNLVEEYSKIAIDILNAKYPSQFKGPIILSNDALIEFFSPKLGLNPLLAHSSARLAHMKLSRYKIDKPIIESRIRGDKLTISSNALIDFNIGSDLFDEEGIPSQKNLLIENSVFKSHFASKQYADYLGIKPTGPLGVVEVEPGTISTEELYKTDKKTRRIYEIVAFSWFCPNDLSGDFSAEIRLGYITEGRKKKPFKGGMLTGNVFDMIKDVHLSNCMIIKQHYKGPEIVKFMNVTVSGR